MSVPKKIVATLIRAYFSNLDIKERSAVVHEPVNQPQDSVTAVCLLEHFTDKDQTWETVTLSTCLSTPIAWRLLAKIPPSTPKFLLLRRKIPSPSNRISLKFVDTICSWFLVFYRTIWWFNLLFYGGLGCIVHNEVSSGILPLWLFLLTIYFLLSESIHLC